MMMEQINKKYDKVVAILKKSKPELGSTEEIENKVLMRISEQQQTGQHTSEVLGILFAWIYINWVRRSLVAASFLLVIAFVVQQSILMKQINHLTTRVESVKLDAAGVSGEYPESRMMLFRFTEKGFPSSEKYNSTRQVEELLRTIDKLKKEYKELDRMIEADPELKKMIEKKLSEIGDNKIKL